MQRRRLKARRLAPQIKPGAVIYAALKGPGALRSITNSQGGDYLKSLRGKIAITLEHENKT
ncbi:MAG: hypothetical protein ACE5JO_11040 [Candidatus Binatia bacterium]